MRIVMKEEILNIADRLRDGEIHSTEAKSLLLIGTVLEKYCYKNGVRVC